MQIAIFEKLKIEDMKKLIIVALAVLCLVSCEKDKIDHPIIGSWVCLESYSYTTDHHKTNVTEPLDTMVFKPDGTFLCGHESKHTYSVVNDSTIVINATINDKFNGQYLIISKEKMFDRPDKEKNVLLQNGIYYQIKRQGKSFYHDN